MTDVLNPNKFLSFLTFSCMGLTFIQPLAVFLIETNFGITTDLSLNNCTLQSNHLLQF